MKFSEKIHDRINNLMVRLKHGRHDQRQHGIWAEGMGGARDGNFPSRGGGGGLAGGIASGAQEMDLANRSRNLQSRTRRNTFADKRKFNAKLNYIQTFTKQRNSERLPNGFDVTPYESSMGVASSGISKVRDFKIGNNTYFYRKHPAYFGERQTGNPIDDVWFSMPTYYMPLVADSISSAMGINIAPVAQLTKQNRIVANDLNFTNDNPEYYFSDLVYDYTVNPIPENYKKMISAIEPLAIMNTLISQSDGHWGNVQVVDASNSPLAGTDKVFASVDYDFSGTKGMYGDILNQEFFDIKKKYGAANEKLLSPEMKATLESMAKNIQWHPSITPFARKQILDRIQIMLDLNETFDIKNDDFDYFVTTLNDHSMNQLKADKTQWRSRNSIVDLQNLVPEFESDVEYVTANLENMAKRSGNNMAIAEEFFRQVYGSSYQTFLSNYEKTEKQLQVLSNKLMNETDYYKAFDLRREAEMFVRRMQSNSPYMANQNRFNETALSYDINENATIKDLNDAVKELMEGISDVASSGIDLKHPVTGDIAPQIRNLFPLFRTLMRQGLGIAVRNKRGRKIATFIDDNDVAAGYNVMTKLMEFIEQQRSGSNNELNDFISQFRSSIRK
jgi:hypothetical protein